MPSVPMMAIRWEMTGELSLLLPSPSRERGVRNDPLSHLPSRRGQFHQMLLGIALLTNAKPDAPAGIGPTIDDAQRDTVLAALRETGFITYQPSEHIPVANAALIVTGGALPADAGNRGVTVARFAAALAPHGSGTLLAGRDGSSIGSTAVAVTRADAGMAGAISTVDDVDVEPGRITAILGLHDLVNGGHPGQYGTGHGATSVTVPQ